MSGQILDSSRGIGMGWEKGVRTVGARGVPGTHKGHPYGGSLTLSRMPPRMPTRAQRSALKVIERTGGVGCQNVMPGPVAFHGRGHG